MGVLWRFNLDSRAPKTKKKTINTIRKESFLTLDFLCLVQNFCRCSYSLPPSTTSYLPQKHALSRERKQSKLDSTVTANCLTLNVSQFDVFHSQSKSRSKSLFSVNTSTTKERVCFSRLSTILRSSPTTRIFRAVQPLSHHPFIIYRYPVVLLRTIPVCFATKFAKTSSLSLAKIPTQPTSQHGAYIHYDQ
jgi:hypothetical protein